MRHGTKQLNSRSCLRSVTFLSPNKKVTKEVGLGGGAECCCSRLRAVNHGILASGKYEDYGFAARSTTLPLRTLSRRASFGVRSLLSAGFCPIILYLISCILYLTKISFFVTTNYSGVYSMNPRSISHWMFWPISGSSKVAVACGGRALRMSSMGRVPSGRLLWVSAVP